jgi:hypothetical protein
MDRARSPREEGLGVDRHHSAELLLAVAGLEHLRQLAEEGHLLHVEGHLAKRPLQRHFLAQPSFPLGLRLGPVLEEERSARIPARRAPGIGQAGHRQACAVRADGPQLPGPRALPECRGLQQAPQGAVAFIQRRAPPQERGFVLVAQQLEAGPVGHGAAPVHAQGQEGGRGSLRQGAQPFQTFPGFRGPAGLGAEGRGAARQQEDGGGVAEGEGRHEAGEGRPVGLPAREEPGGGGEAVEKEQRRSGRRSKIP